MGEVYPSLSDGKVRQVLVKYKNPRERGYRVSERHANKLVLIVPVGEQSINEDTNQLVPSAQNGSEQVPFAQDKIGGEDVSGQQGRDQPGDEVEELTDQAEAIRPDANPDPDDAAVGAAGDTESEQSLAADGDHNLTGVNPPSGVAPRHLRHKELSTNPDWVGRLRAA